MDGKDEGGNTKTIDKDDVITIEDFKGNKKMIHGSIEGFTIKKPIKYVGRRASSAIIGFDKDWGGKRVLCILLE